MGGGGKGWGGWVLEREPPMTSIIPIRIISTSWTMMNLRDWRRQQRFSTWRRRQEKPEARRKREASARFGASLEGGVLTNEALEWRFRPFAQGDEEREVLFLP